MSQTSFKIPRRGGAGVAFMGVEMADALIFLVSIPLALVLGSLFGMGTKAYLGVPVAGFFLNRTLIEWRANQLPGAFREWLFAHGIAGYSKRLNSQSVVYTGDATVVLPGRRIEHLLQALKEQHGND